MEESRCSAPGCGALIGGRNHNSALGTVRLGAGAQAETPGYIPIPDTDDESLISRLVLRFFVHCSLFICTSNLRSCRALHKILSLSDSHSADHVDQVLRERLERDYSLLKAKTQFADDDLSMALHQVLKASSVPEIMNLDLRHAANRFCPVVPELVSSQKQARLRRHFPKNGHGPNLRLKEVELIC
jgi:hypothetical protein